MNVADDPGPPVDPDHPSRVPRFPLGQVVATPAALRILEAHQMSPQWLLALHASGVWGDVDADDQAANERAVVHGGRILSAYQLGDDRLWVITEADRSSTCILPPADY